jgi:hypothetical protein
MQAEMRNSQKITHIRTERGKFGDPGTDGT